MKLKSWVNWINKLNIFLAKENVHVTMTTTAKKALLK